MKIKYDAEVDVLMIYLREGEYVDREEIGNMSVDFDKEGNPLTIEILNASQVLDIKGTFSVKTPVLLKQTAQG